MSWVKYFRFWRPYFHFRLSHIVAHTWRHLIWAPPTAAVVKNAVYTVELWMLYVAVSATTSGFDGRIAISGVVQCHNCMLTLFGSSIWSKIQDCSRNCTAIRRTAEDISTSGLAKQTGSTYISRNMTDISGCRSSSQTLYFGPAIIENTRSALKTSTLCVVVPEL